MEKIQKVSKGDSDWTMMHEQLANQVIAACNREIKVYPEDKADVQITDSNITITFNEEEDDGGAGDLVSVEVTVWHLGKLMKGKFYTDGELEEV